MRLHPRVLIVNQAEREMSKVISDVATKFDLTFAEVIIIVQACLQMHAMYAIRHERHPDDPEKKGGEA